MQIRQLNNAAVVELTYSLLPSLMAHSQGRIAVLETLAAKAAQLASRRRGSYEHSGSTG